MTERGHFDISTPAEPLSARLPLALVRKAALTLFGPSDIVRASPLAHRHPANSPHALSAAQLALPKSAFNSQAPR